MGMFISTLKNHYHLLIIAVLFILLVVSLVYSSVVKNELDGYSSGFPIVGTYISGHELSSDAEYMAFTPNHRKKSAYYRYKQFEPLEEGLYVRSDDDPNIYMLYNNASNEEYSHLLLSSEKLYLFNKKNNDIVVYNKIQNTAIIINAEKKADE